MIVDYLAFRPAFEAELKVLWKALSGEERRAEEFSACRAECAFTDGELIGCAMIEVRGGLAWLRIGVKEDSRGCGVGRKLLRNACARAKQAGFSSLAVWGVPKGDRIASALFSDEGFRRVGVLEKGLGDRDCLIYQKTF